ncbi:unnamed protein product [Urochloa decumbens]|uniref:Uncharacterized protein n=1 Tax=Urochloa decumbens TaxID=240449 RepID=A0ABC9BLP1_9POAL
MASGGCTDLRAAATGAAAASSSSSPPSPLEGPPPHHSRRYKEVITTNVDASTTSTTTVAAASTPSLPLSLLQRPQQHPVMPTKGAAKKAQGLRTTELSLHPYEELRLRQCMRNNSRLQQLGLPALALYAKTIVTRQDKNSRNGRNTEDPDPEYDPLHDDTVERGLIDDVNSKGTKEMAHKKTNKQTSEQPPGGVKFQSRKRVYPFQQPTVTTRSKKSTGQPDASMTQTVICVPPPLHPNAELVSNFEDQPNDNGGDAIPQSDGHNHMAAEDDLPLPGQNATMDEGADGHNQLTRKGVNMGHGLQSLTRARGSRLPIVITEGNIRPLVPLLAAKYATECNIAVRNHMPVLKCWKDYERQPALFNEFMNILRAKFDIDTNNETVKAGCLEMMKSAVRQRRYKLKQKYFDPFPLHLVSKTSPIPKTSNEQWLQLVESWKSPKKMETCQKNKENRSNVKFPQATGCRSYPVLVESLTEMENQLATPREGEEQPNSATHAVGNVLKQRTKKNCFLRNVGIKIARARSNVQNVEAELQVEKRVNAELRDQVDALTRQMQETEHARIRDQEENKKRQSEMEAKLELLLARSQPS